MALKSPRLTLVLIAALAACSPHSPEGPNGEHGGAFAHGIQDLPPDPDLKPSLSSAKLNTWREKRAEQCLTIAEQPSNDIERELAAIRDAIEGTDLGQRTFNELRGTKVSLCHEDSGFFDGEDTDKVAGLFKSKHRALGVVERVSEGRQILTGAHEYRHAWQNYAVEDAFGKGLGQVAHATRNFIIEADARTFAVAIAWQLKQQGDDRAWDAAMDLTKSYKPMAEAFEARMEQIAADEGQAAINSDSALTRSMSDAYNAWFTEPGNRQSYVNSLNRLFVKTMDSWASTATLPQGFAVQIGRVPGTGSSYLGHGALAQAEIEAVRSVQFPEGTIMPDRHAVAGPNLVNPGIGRP
ncbi:MAG: hypothetical protein KI792_08990 [Alphaproteobacteria bacterium]|nr:hypothetical protein [Alphaproteobacteria bacterium SS10]